MFLNINVSLLFYYCFLRPFYQLTSYFCSSHVFLVIVYLLRLPAFIVMTLIKFCRICLRASNNSVSFSGSVFLQSNARGQIWTSRNAFSL